MTAPLRRIATYLLAAATAIAVLAIIALAIASRTQVQNERARSVRTSCQQTNARNRNTKRIVNRKFPAGQGRSITYLLIDALAPVQNCDELVNQRVPGH